MGTCVFLIWPFPMAHTHRTFRSQHITFGTAIQVLRICFPKFTPCEAVADKKKPPMPSQLQALKYCLPEFQDDFEIVSEASDIHPGPDSINM